MGIIMGHTSRKRKQTKTGTLDHRFETPTILVNGVGTGFGDHQQGVDHIGVACGGCQVQRRPA